MSAEVIDFPANDNADIQFTVFEQVFNSHGDMIEVHGFDHETEEVVAIRFADGESGDIIGSIKFKTLE